MIKNEEARGRAFDFFQLEFGALGFVWDLVLGIWSFRL
jgi:hypothetical protein